ncbi:hypothetical protein AMATHDRAFT_142781 [Amanita thiersii Skay4041]|uniref:RNA helicase n=1 Tax=Amanita thiersii Skay4041 TaxID=703135 RepID=A0A2A9NMY4_9AGAR|nr:hypothetical protein AMATHDRAFT_142781 [Amanita thiersii Skay4041]
MARSAALNPASVPFFPGGIRSCEDATSTMSLTSQEPREQDQTSVSSRSVSSPEHRSFTSSPSPLSEKRIAVSSQSPEPLIEPQTSPAIRQFDTTRPRPIFEARIQREPTMVSALSTLPEGEESQESSVPVVIGSRTQTPGTTFYHLQQQQGREHLSTPPIAINFNSNPFPATAFSSASPVSSLDSGSHFSSNAEHQTVTIEAQLKASPLIRDILDRLVRCEFSTREIQHDLGELHRKVNLLLERALTTSTQPEFKDPFASGVNGSTLASAQLNGMRPSIANIAPNQVAPADDISTISQRLNTLTSSVGQLLALQTQQLQQTANAELRNNSIVNLTTSPEVAPNQILSSAMANQAGLGQGLPGRQDLRPSPRPPNPPLRTWSTGNLDLPLRPSESITLRQEPVPVRDKRRSVTGLLRRESTGILDIQGDGSSRDSGPVITKWEQLSLAPELLRSLAKFGLGPPNKIQQRALPFLLRGADIIAQAPPTQERIAAYVIPAIQITLTHMLNRPTNRPIVIMVSTTVDQATQAQRMIRDLGGPIGIRSALGVGTTNANSDLSQEIRLLQQNMPHIVCGTPQKLHALFTTPGGLVGSEVRFLVLDEVDQLIARNLHDFVFNIVKLLPPPRSRPLGPSTPTPTGSSSLSPGFDANSAPGSAFQPPVRRFSAVPSPNPDSNNLAQSPIGIERQTALFSNTVPQDVLNLASAIHLREPVRVLVRRDGNVTHPENNQNSRGLKQFYLYLAFTTGSGRSETTTTTSGGGLGIIGSGRGAANPESAQAREWKLDALADLFDDVDVTHAIVHVGGMSALDTVVYKLASRGLEAVPLHGDMNPGTKLAALNKFRGTNPVTIRQSAATKVLVIYDVQVKTPEISHVPLIVNYDLPKAVEEYAHRVSPAVANNYSRAGVVINFVTATGGDVEMLRSIECFYKIKCPEVPMSLRDIV